MGTNRVLFKFILCVFVFAGLGCHYNILAEMGVTTTMQNKQFGKFSLISEGSGETSIAGIWYSANQFSSDSSVQPIGIIISEPNYTNIAGSSMLNPLMSSSDSPFLLSKPLVYPNPFSFKKGGEIRYRLGANMNLKLLIYNMYGKKILEENLEAGSLAATNARVSSIKIDQSLFGGKSLSTGVYFFYILKDGEILSSEDGSIIAKGKMAVVP